MINHGEHGETQKAEELLIDRGLSCAAQVYRLLGPGLLESVYEVALAYKLGKARVLVKRQVEAPVIYESIHLGVGFRADLVVEWALLLELKAVEAIKPIYLAQIISYLKLMEIKRGYILNFNTRLLKEGIKRVSI